MVRFILNAFFRTFIIPCSLGIKKLHATTIHATVSFDFQREYQKQRKETIDNFRGFQTMDSSDHPVVQRGIKAAELISDVSFRCYRDFLSHFGVTFLLCCSLSLQFHF